MTQIVFVTSLATRVLNPETTFPVLLQAISL
jgi:hypothetical protein